MLLTTEPFSLFVIFFLNSMKCMHFLYILFLFEKLKQDSIHNIMESYLYMGYVKAQQITRKSVNTIEKCSRFK